MESSSNNKHDDFLWEYIALDDIPQKIPSGYLLDPEGIHIREQQIPKDGPKVFFLGDHLGLNENEKSFLSGYQTISLGKKELLGSQCVTIIYHYLDELE